MTRSILFAVLLALGALTTGCAHSTSARQSAAMEAGGPTEETAWWNSTVFYQVFVRSYADAASGPLACDGIGDFQGLIDRLDYLNDGDPSTTDDLGVTGLWLMPVMQSPSYHGYDVVDYYTVEQDYGTNEDFRRFLDEAHRRGIRVILDLVFNHTSDAHPWFAEAVELKQTYRDWYLWRDREPDYRGPWDQRVWHERVGEYYYGIFGPHMPDLNYTNPEVTEAIHEITRYWLEDVGVDGFRLDAIRHLIEDGPVQENTPETHAWLQDFFTFYKSVDSDAMTVGEVWDRTENVAPYIRDRELDLAFEFDLADAIVAAVNGSDAAPLVAQERKAWETYPSSQYATFLRNHDQNRVMSELGDDMSKAKAAATVLLTSPGVPFLYYGEEIGMLGVKPDPKIRTPMQWSAGAHSGFSACEPWQAVNSDYSTRNVEAQAADPSSLLNLYRSLVHLRQSHEALQVGTYTPVTADAPSVAAFLRHTRDEALLVIVNLGTEPVRSYGLTLEEGPLGRVREAAELLHEASARRPRRTPNGGFNAYRPLDELAPRTGYVIWLGG